MSLKEDLRGRGRDSGQSAYGRGLPSSSPLPSLPYVSHQVLLAMNGADVDIHSVADTISQDPALTARLISMANSAYFRSRQPIYSPSEALMRLGLNRVRIMAVSIVLSQQFDGTRCPAFDTADFWYQSMACAHAAGLLGERLRLDAGRDAATLCGLMHCIGQFLLVHAFPRDMDALLTELRQSPELEPHLLERRRLGFDRYAAGAMLLREWELPAPVADAIEAIPEPYGASGEWTLTRLLRGTIAWVRADFTGLPLELEDPEKLPDSIVASVRDSCLRERDLLQGIASLLV